MIIAGIATVLTIWLVFGGISSFVMWENKFDIGTWGEGTRFLFALFVIGGCGIACGLVWETHSNKRVK